MSTSTDASGSKIAFYEDRRDEIVASFREELQKAGFSVQDKDITRILNKRHQKIIRRNKTNPQEQRLNEDDIELLKQHRLLKKRLRALCDELVVKRESSAVRIQETARDCHQAVHEAMLQKKQKLEEKITAYKSTSVPTSSNLDVENETDNTFENISQSWEKIQRLSQVIGDLESMQQNADNEDLEDSCDIQHVGRETVIKASEDSENDPLTLGEDYLPLTFDRDHEIIPNNAKMIDS